VSARTRRRSGRGRPSRAQALQDHRRARERARRSMRRPDLGLPELCVFASGPRP
jgi:hypothetical protein